MSEHGEIQTHNPHSEQCCREATSGGVPPRHGLMVACTKGHVWVFSDSDGWARVASQEEAAEKIGDVYTAAGLGVMGWGATEAAAQADWERKLRAKATPREVAQVLDEPPPEPLHAAFNASPESRCVPKWLTGPIHHAFTPGASICQCGQTETSDPSGTFSMNTVRLRKEPADEHANAGQQGGQEPPRSAGLARGSGSPPRSTDLARGGAGAPIGGAGELRPVPGVEDTAAERREGAAVAIERGQAAAEAVPGGGEQAVPAGAGGAAVRAPPGYVAIPVEQLDRACRFAGVAWGTDRQGQFYLVHPGDMPGTAAGSPMDQEVAAAPFRNGPSVMSEERAWAQQRLADAEVRAAARHAETVELLKEEVRLLGLLRDAAYFKEQPAAKMGAGDDADWTVDPATRRTNSSVAFIAIRDALAGLLREEGTSGRGEPARAQFLLAQLAHKHGMRPAMAVEITGPAERGDE